jgi:hypothetical protein
MEEEKGAENYIFSCLCFINYRKQWILQSLCLRLSEFRETQNPPPAFFTPSVHPFAHPQMTMPKL